MTHLSCRSLRNRPSTKSTTDSSASRPEFRQDRAVAFMIGMHARPQPVVQKPFLKCLGRVDFMEFQAGQITPTVCGLKRLRKVGGQCAEALFDSAADRTDPVGVLLDQFQRAEGCKGGQRGRSVRADRVVLLEHIVTLSHQHAGQRMKTGRHAFAQHDQVGLQAQHSKREHFGLPEPGLNLIQAQQRTGVATPALGA